MEANAFASALLIDKNLLEQFLEEQKGTIVTYKKIKIAALAFEVSDMIMTHRLTKLKML